MNIRILLADNNQLMRDSLRSLIEKQPGMEVVSEAENADNAIQRALAYKPDVVVMDINMADLRDPDAVRKMIS